MRRVESYAALTPLLSAQLRRGVVTNCFLSPADYQREIDAGLFLRGRRRLFAAASSGPDTGS